MRISRLKLVLLLAMSAFGLWASSMVLILYYFLKQALPFCPPSQQLFGWLSLDCNTVLGSRYSQVFGIPLELLAVIYFVVNISLVYVIAFGSDRSSERSLDLLFVWRFIGVLIVPYLLFVELVLLKAVCVYCTVMHTSIILDFIVITYLLYYRHDALGASPADASESALHILSTDSASLCDLKLQDPR